MAWLIDTNVISEIRRTRPHPNVLAFIEDQSAEDLFLSVVPLAEIRFGIATVSDSGKRLQLGHWLETRIRPMFEGRVLGLTEDVLLTWRLVVEEGRRAGRTFSQPDSLIAATALSHGLTVVSRDRVHYDQMLVRVLDPWSFGEQTED